MSTTINKDQLSSEKDTRNPLEQAIDSNPCKRCRTILKVPKCACMVGGYGSLEEMDDCSLVQNLLAEEATMRLAPVDGKRKINVVVDDAADEDDESLQYRLAERRLTPEQTIPELMLALLAKDLLFIHQNQLDGILTLLYQYSPKQQPGDRHKFQKLIEMYLQEVEDFKRRNLILANCAVIETDLQGNIIGLRISFPKPGQYDSFMAMLMLRNLLLIQNGSPLNYANRLTPLATRLTPAQRRGRNVDDEEEQNYSPLRPRNPADRLKKLKPNGF